MPWNPFSCPVCGKQKPAVWDLCLACLREYGDRDEWPGWVVYVVQEERRERYYQGERCRLEFDVDPDWFDYGEGDYAIEELRTRLGPEMAWSERDRMLLPDGPYDDEELNRQYRESHRIVNPDIIRTQEEEA